MYITQRYADDITLRAESEEELNSLLMKVKEESEKADLEPNLCIFAMGLLMGHRKTTAKPKQKRERKRPASASLPPGT